MARHNSRYWPPQSNAMMLGIVPACDRCFGSKTTMKTDEIKKIGTPPGERSSRPTHSEISRLAYQLFEREGKPEGKHLEHWFNAESMTESNFGYGRDHAEHDFTQTNGNE
jgi:hypothetical protein